jgi:hypothetical protein
MKTIWLIIGFMSLTTRAFSSELPDLRALRAIASDISSAMQKEDYGKVLLYDFPELREEHQKDLQNKSSDFYCYLIGEGCQSETKYHSIHSQFASMKKVDITLKRLSGVTYVVIFFDSTKYERASIVRTSFLCKHANVDVPIWTFKWDEGRWKAMHPVFNSETDPFCSTPYGVDK